MFSVLISFPHLITSIPNIAQKCYIHTHYSFSSHSYFVYMLFFSFLCSSDHAELLTQIWAAHPHSTRRRATQNDNQPFLPWNPVHSSHCIPEWGSELHHTLVLKHQVILVVSAMVIWRWRVFVNVACVSFQITALKIKYNPFAKAFLDAKERYISTSCPQRCLVPFSYTNLIEMYVGKGGKKSIIFLFVCLFCFWFVEVIIRK